MGCELGAITTCTQSHSSPSDHAIQCEDQAAGPSFLSSWCFQIQGFADHPYQWTGVGVPSSPGQLFNNLGL